MIKTDLLILNQDLVRGGRYYTLVTQTILYNESQSMISAELHHRYPDLSDKQTGLLERSGYL